jgi:phage major head subunit gpT-like protein
VRNPSESLTTTVQLPPLSRKAVVTPASIDDGARTVELDFATGAGVERMDWYSGKRYVEKLSMDPAHVRLERLNGRAPLLDAHSSYSIKDQIGVVVPNSASIVAKKGRATVQFSKRAEVEPIWQDVRDGIIANVSVGYFIYKFDEVVGKEGTLPIRTAIDWEPYEISMVPMPADMHAQTRGAQPTLETRACEIITRQAAPVRETPTTEDQPMKPEQSEFVAERNPLDPGAPTGQAGGAAAPVEPTDRDRGVETERERIQGILTAVRAARLPQTVADGLIKDGTSLVQAQARVFEEMGKREDPNPVPSGAGARYELGEDPLVHQRAGIENAILHRAAPGFFKLETIGRKYRGMTMLDIARVFLQARGVRTTDCSKMELAGLALGLEARGGMHTTSDFPLLMADVATKTLRAAYEEAEQTFKSIGRRVTLPDFKISNRMQLGDAPALLEVREHGEFTRGTIAEGKEALQLKTFGRVFAITRQALVNDDTDAFSRVPTAFGRSARTLEADLVWAQITSNPTMGDGVALFHASHGNLDAVASVISVASLGKARAAMRIQKGLDGATLLNINPKYLGVPAALETTAGTFLVQITPAVPASVNPFAGVLSALVEPRLDANSVTAWYLFAGVGVDVIEYAYLEGEEGPAVESRIGFDVDGLEIKCRLDFAAKVIDHRGVWKNPGV